MDFFRSEIGEIFVRFRILFSFKQAMSDGSISFRSDSIALLKKPGNFSIFIETNNNCVTEEEIDPTESTSDIHSPFRIENESFSSIFQSL